MSEKLYMNNELHRIVQNAGQSVEFSALESEYAQDWVRARLQLVRIYTVAPGDDQNTDAAKRKVAAGVAAGIEVFECERIKCVPERLTGKLDAVVLLALNGAIEENYIVRWHRKFAFYYKNGNKDIYFPYDMDKQEVFWQHLQHKEIFALEGSQEELFLGKVVTYSGFFGTQRFAIKYLYQLSSTSMERVISAIARNEGGGYDTVNSYDGVFLSVGLFHWNQDWLWELMNTYRGKYPNLYEEFAERLGFEEVKWEDGDRQFKINGKFYKMGNLEVLRRLKYVYLFLREAEKKEFREAQDRTASAWVETALRRTLSVNGRLRQLGEYVTSELAVALYVDMTVITGEGDGAEFVREAIGEALEQINEPNPEKWENDEEKLVIDALKKKYEEKVLSTRLALRGTITPALSQDRRSFRSV